MLNQLNNQVVNAKNKLLLRQDKVSWQYIKVKQTTTERLIAPTSLVVSFLGGVTTGLLKTKTKEVSNEEQKKSSSDSYGRLFKYLSRLAISTILNFALIDRTAAETVDEAASNQELL